MDEIKNMFWAYDCKNCGNIHKLSEICPIEGESKNFIDNELSNQTFSLLKQHFYQFNIWCNREGWVVSLDNETWYHKDDFLREEIKTTNQLYDMFFSEKMN